MRRRWHTAICEEKANKGREALISSECSHFSLMRRDLATVRPKAAGDSPADICRNIMKANEFAFL